MGYTHYWYRELEIEPEKFSAIVRDFKTLLAPLESFGVRIGDGIGEGTPELDDVCVAFNGLDKCGHPKNSEISIPWPSENAGGVATYRESEGGTAVAGRWYAGAVIDKRACNGNCSYETFAFPRKMKAHEWDDKRPDGLHFDCCKTAFRPYDLAVTAFLVIAKHHLKDRIQVTSDGDPQHWFDAMMLCKTNVGYGLGFQLDPN